jgi:AraC-like DNA-binding protein
MCFFRTRLLSHKRFILSGDFCQASSKKYARKNQNWIIISIKEITYQAGFDEPTNLIKFFKQRTGQTPAQFRRGFA